MERVGWADHSGVPWVVEIVQHTVTQAHIQPNVRLDGVHGHAGGAHVGLVAGAKLNPL